MKLVRLSAQRMVFLAVTLMFLSGRQSPPSLLLVRMVSWAVALLMDKPTTFIFLTLRFIYWSHKLNSEPEDVI